jgi:UDP-N-acetylglucosamine pyrophosphorylase
VTAKLLFFENIRRRLVRVLKLYRGFIPTTKTKYQDKQIGISPPGPGGVFRFKKKSKLVLGFQNFGYEFLRVGEDV